MFVRNPQSGIRGVLLYGPDAGLIRERSQTVVGTVVEEVSDPFRVAELEAVQLRVEPARLWDEVAALALGGGRRVVRIREAGDGTASLLKEFLAGALGDALVVVEAGELGTRSSLRRVFEESDAGASVPCYQDEGVALDDVLRETLASEEISLSAEARAFLREHLGADRLVTRQELGKLALYVGAGARAELDDVAAVIGDSGRQSVEDVVYAAADGQYAELEQALSRAYLDGTSPVTLLRAVARHMQRLLSVNAGIARGETADHAIRDLRPRVFFKLVDRFRAQVGLWTREGLWAVLDKAIQAEMRCKSTGIPAGTVCHRAMTEIAAAARRRQANQPVAQG